jgi:endogenous inhibitor of DNA gyrase (YacG/DUF329 family)
MKPCPICSRPCGPRPDNDQAPFCSERCKLIDLGNWLGGTYRIPGRPEEDEDEQPSGSPAATEDEDR